MNVCQKCTGAIDTPSMAPGVCQECWERIASEAWWWKINRISQSKKLPLDDMEVTEGLRHTLDL